MDLASMEKYVFVYGTLKKNHRNHTHIERLNPKFIGKCKTEEKYPLYKHLDPFPYLKNQKGIGNKIKGEVYLIKKEDQKELDYFEGVPFLYKSGEIDVILESGVKLEGVLCYFVTKPVDLNKVTLLEEW